MVVSRRGRDANGGDPEQGELAPLSSPGGAHSHPPDPSWQSPGISSAPDPGPPGGIRPRRAAWRRERGEGGPLQGELTPVAVGIRFFVTVSVINLGLVGVLLFLRLALPPLCTPRGKEHEEGERRARDGKWRHDPNYLRQLERVAQRTFFRRNVTRSRHIHAINDALIPTLSCPQKRRVGGMHPGSYYWLCAPQHMMKMHWPMAYGLGKPGDFAYEIELHQRFSIHSTIFDPLLPPTRTVSREFPFVNIVGGVEAEPGLAKILVDTSRAHAASTANYGSSDPSFFGGAPALRVSCYGCEHSFLTPLFEHTALGFPAASPAMGQIVLVLDRWGAPFHEATLHAVKVLERAGYYMFHSEQVFGSYRNQSYLVSFIHQAMLFPNLLHKNHTWI